MYAAVMPSAKKSWKTWCLKEIWFLYCENTSTTGFV